MNTEKPFGMEFLEEVPLIEQFGGDDDQPVIATSHSSCCGESDMDVG